MIQSMNEFKQDADQICFLFFNGLARTFDWHLRAALFPLLLQEDHAWSHPGEGKLINWTSLLLKLPAINRILIYVPSLGFDIIPSRDFPSTTIGTDTGSGEFSSICTLKRPICLKSTF